MIKSTEKALLQMVADKIGVPYSDLYDLIKFESNWNPQAENPLSSAKGLIQFTDKTAVELGYKSSSDLIKKAKTIIDQLPLVERYLMKYMPYSSKQSLFMAVFYPAARNWSSSNVFPESVRKANPGIVTVGDYMKKAGGDSYVVDNSIIVAAALFVAAVLIYKKGR